MLLKVKGHGLYRMRVSEDGPRNRQSRKITGGVGIKADALGGKTTGWGHKKPTDKVKKSGRESDRCMKKIGS